MDKVNQLLDLVKSNPDAQKIAQELGIPKTDREAADGYLRVAKAMGIDMTETELLDGLHALMQEQHARSEQAAEKISLDEVSLDNVAGGLTECGSTYEPGEWCWFSDSCDAVINYYNPSADWEVYEIQEKELNSDDGFFDYKIPYQNLVCMNDSTVNLSVINCTSLGCY